MKLLWKHHLLLLHRINNDSDRVSVPDLFATTTTTTTTTTRNDVQQQQQQQQQQRTDLRSCHHINNYNKSILYRRRSPLSSSWVMLLLLLVSVIIMIGSLFLHNTIFSLYYNNNNVPQQIRLYPSKFNRYLLVVLLPKHVVLPVQRLPMISSSSSFVVEAATSVLPMTAFVVPSSQKKKKQLTFLFDEGKRKPQLMGDSYKGSRFLSSFTPSCRSTTTAVHIDNNSNNSNNNVGGYDPSEGIDVSDRIKEKNIVGNPQQVQTMEKEFSVTSILKELAAIQQQGPQKYCILGTRHCSYLHQQIIELLAYALVLSGNHVYTSGSSGTNAATIRGALRAERSDLLTVVLPQSLMKQTEESQQLLKQVKDVIEMPQNNDLSLDIASRICNSYLLSLTDQLISFAFHESTTVIEAAKEAKELDKLVTVLFLD